MSDAPAFKPSILLIAVVVLASLVTVLDVLVVFTTVQYLFWLAFHGDAVDVWTALSVLQMLLAIIGAVGAWAFIRRGKLRLALLFLPLPFVGTFLVEANRCDVYPSCAWSQWATLPRAAFEWRVPLRKSSYATDMGRPGPDRSRHNHVLKALDGDTLLFDGRVVHIAGIDAPELGQTAKCWAEAALGGESRNALDGQLSGPRRPDWELAEVSPPDAKGRVRANLVSKDGDDLRDHMIVYGFAARTDGRWNWCGPDPDLHSPRQGETSPHGPSMWWPADDIYDARAAD